MHSNERWVRFGTYMQPSQDRIWQAGLSRDGRRCFFSLANEIFFVWDIDESRVVWQKELGPVGDGFNDFPYAVAHGCIEIETPGPAAGLYRIIGDELSFPITQWGDTELRADVETSKLVILREGRE